MIEERPFEAHGKQSAGHGGGPVLFEAPLDTPFEAQGKRGEQGKEVGKSIIPQSNVFV